MTIPGRGGIGVREAEGAGRGERWWSAVCGRPAGSSKLVACQSQVLRFELSVDCCCGARRRAPGGAFFRFSYFQK